MQRPKPGTWAVEEHLALGSLLRPAGALVPDLFIARGRTSPGFQGRVSGKGTRQSVGGAGTRSRMKCSDVAHGAVRGVGLVRKAGEVRLMKSSLKCLRGYLATICSRTSAGNWSKPRPSTSRPSRIEQRHFGLHVWA